MYKKQEINELIACLDHEDIMVVHRGLLGLSSLKPEIRQWREEEKLCKTGIVEKLVGVYRTRFPILKLHSMFLLQLLAEKLSQQNGSIFFNSHHFPPFIFADAVLRK
jgi:hypothetical protein